MMVPIGRHPAEPFFLRRPAFRGFGQTQPGLQGQVLFFQCLVLGEQGLMLEKQRFEIHHGTHWQCIRVRDVKSGGYCQGNISYLISPKKDKGLPERDNPGDRLGTAF